MNEAVNMLEKTSKVADENCLVELLQKEIVTKHLEVTALIQVKLKCNHNFFTFTTYICLNEFK